MIGLTNYLQKEEYSMIKDISASIEACAAHYGDNADAMRQYLIEGQAKAVALPNRGPLTFDEHGQLDKGILDAYQTYGFIYLKTYWIKTNSQI